MDIPAPIEQAVGNVVTRQLETELRNRGLLLAAEDLAAAETGAMRCGARLLTSFIHRCYPITRQAGSAVALDFGSAPGEARLLATLAFGAAAARVLAPNQRNTNVELICATFNLGIGLVDSICDEDAEAGGALLHLVQAQNLANAVEQRRARGWLRANLSPLLAANPTAVFTVDVIETFFETLHDIFPDARWRRCLGVQLGKALEAERTSVAPSAEATCEDLLKCSRLTSVLPFQIIETLAEAGHAQAQPSAGTQLGEAMWAIDDLVDLCHDARTGSLNGILLAAGGNDVVATLEWLLASTVIACTARRAVDNLQAGLQRADDPIPFLYFVQRYAGIVPRPAS